MPNKTKRSVGNAVWHHPYTNSSAIDVISQPDETVTQDIHSKKKLTYNQI
jgi:hypothetical protein